MDYYCGNKSQQDEKNIDNAAQLADFKRRKHTNMAVDKHGRDVFLADTSYALALAQENFKDIRFHFTSEF